MPPLFVTAVYDVYGGAFGSPECSRTAAIWQRLARIADGLPWLHVFADREAPVALRTASVEVLPLAQTELFRSLEWVPRLPLEHAAGKDTAAYLKLQCAKAEFLLRAASRHPDAGAVVWIDAGICKILPEAADPAAAVSELARAAALLLESGSADSLVVPGCWARQASLAPMHLVAGVRWRFCGGICFVPRALAARFAAETLAAARALAVVTGRLTWEVNVWELLESTGAVPFEWYLGDHDGSMLRCLHHAVARRGAASRVQKT